MSDAYKINVSLLKTYESNFNNERNNFNNKTYETFLSSYLKTCSDPYVHSMSTELQRIYEQIKKGYNNIDKWWVDYNNNAETLENYLSGTGSIGAITEVSVRNSVNNLPELEDYSVRYTKAYYSTLINQQVLNNPQLMAIQNAVSGAQTIGQDIDAIIPANQPAPASTPVSAPPKQEEKKEEKGGLFKWFKDTGAKIANTASNIANTVSDAVNDAKEWVSDTAAIVTETVSTAWNNTTEFISNAAQDVGEYISDSFTNVGNFVSNTTSSIGEYFDNRLENVSNLIKNPTNLGSFITNSFSNTSNFFSDTLENVGGFISNSAKNTGNLIYDTFENIGNYAYNTLENVGNFITDVGAQVNKVGEAVYSNVSNLVNNATEVIKNTAAVVGTTVKNTWNNAKEWVSDTASNISNTFKEGWEDFTNWFNDTKETIQDVNETIEALIREMQETVKEVLESTAATVATAVVSLAEGVLQFGEALVDVVALAGTVVATIGTGLWDGGQAIYGAITGNEWESVTKQMWEGTKGFVAEERVKNGFNEFYDETMLGQWMKNNAYFFDVTRSIGSGIGYVAGVVALTYFTAGLGNAALASAGATTTVNTAHLMTGIATAAGMGRGTQTSWSSGADIVEGLVAGVLTGLWEGFQFWAGGKINAMDPFKDKIKNQLLQKIVKTTLAVGADTLDGAAEGFVQPAIAMIYDDYYYDENGNEIAYTEEEKSLINIWNHYIQEFNDAGGFTNVFVQGAVAGGASVLGEVIDIKEYFDILDNIKKQTEINTGEILDDVNIPKILDDVNIPKNDNISEGIAGDIDKIKSIQDLIQKIQNQPDFDPSKSIQYQELLKSLSVEQIDLLKSIASDTNFGKTVNYNTILNDQIDDINKTITFKYADGTSKTMTFEEFQWNNPDNPTQASVTEFINKNIDEMLEIQSAIYENNMQADTIIYSKIGLEELETRGIKITDSVEEINAKMGKAYAQNGFITGSTTLDSNLPEGTVNLIMNCKEGTPFAAFSAVDPSKTDVVLPYELNFKIDGVEKKIIDGQEQIFVYMSSADMQDMSAAELADVLKQRSNYNAEEVISYITNSHQLLDVIGETNDKATINKLIKDYMSKDIEELIMLANDTNTSKIINSLNGLELADLIEKITTSDSLDKVLRNVDIGNLRKSIFYLDDVLTNDIVSKLEPQQLADFMKIIDEYKVNDIVSAFDTPKLLDVIDRLENTDVAKIINNISTKQLSDVITQIPEQNMFKITDVLEEQQIINILKSLDDNAQSKVINNMKAYQLLDIFAKNGDSNALILENINDVQLLKIMQESNNKDSLKAFINSMPIDRIKTIINENTIKNISPTIDLLEHKNLITLIKNSDEPSLILNNMSIERFTDMIENCHENDAPTLIKLFGSMNKKQREILLTDNPYFKKMRAKMEDSFAESIKGIIEEQFGAE